MHFEIHDSSGTGLDNISAATAEMLAMGSLAGGGADPDVADPITSAESIGQHVDHGGSIRTATQHEARRWTGRGHPPAIVAMRSRR